jgi:hypothetical protein
VKSVLIKHSDYTVGTSMNNIPECCGYVENFLYEHPRNKLSKLVESESLSQMFMSELDFVTEQSGWHLTYVSRNLIDLHHINDARWRTLYRVVRHMAHTLYLNWLLGDHQIGYTDEYGVLTVLEAPFKAAFILALNSNR